jgi:hypothetical protein
MFSWCSARVISFVTPPLQFVTRLGAGPASAWRHFWGDSGRDVCAARIKARMCAKEKWHGDADQCLGEETISAQ